MTERPLNKRARKRLRQERERQEAERRWAPALEALRALEEDGLAGPAGRPVDFELIPPFDGTLNDTSIWLVFQTTDQAERAKEPRAAARLEERVKEIFAGVGYPADAIADLSVGITSAEEIEAGGGSFYFFR